MFSTDKRTQLYLPLGLYQEAKNLAKQRGKSLAEIVREALREYLTRFSKSKNAWKNDSLNELVGFFDEGPEDLSKKVDDFLYR